jgi:hypothetical protein
LRSKSKPFSQNFKTKTLVKMIKETKFILNNKEHTFLAARKILMKGQAKTVDNYKSAYAYLMWRCKKA